MLTSELVEFYGLDGDATRDDFVAALNGMIGYSDANRKAMWVKFCESLGSVMEEMKKAREKNYDELEQKHAELLLHLAQDKNEIRDLKESNNALKSSNQELVGKVTEVEKLNEVLTANIEISKRVAARVEVELNSEKQKNKAGGAKPVEVLGGTARIPGNASKASEEELRANIQHMIKEKDLMSKEIARLVQIVKAVAEAEHVPLEATRRFTAEEFNKERKLRQATSDQLKSLAKDALTWNQKFEDFVTEHKAEAEKEKSGFQKKIEDLMKEVATLKLGVVPVQRITDMTPLLASFIRPNGELMVCPVPTCGGYLIQLIDVYDHWKKFPCDYEGTTFASFICMQTGKTTSLANMDLVCLFLRIAADLRINVNMPFACKYRSNGQWVFFSYVDQITIASVLCKMYREGIVDGYENIMVSRGFFGLTIHICKNLVELQLQVMHDPDQTSKACFTSLVPDFFPRWNFVNNFADLME